MRKDGKTSEKRGMERREKERKEKGVKRMEAKEK